MQTAISLVVLAKYWFLRFASYDSGENSTPGKPWVRLVIKEEKGYPGSLENQMSGVLVLIS